MTVDTITQAQWRVDDAERELAEAQERAQIARGLEQCAVERLKIAKADLAFRRREVRRG